MADEHPTTTSTSAPSDTEAQGFTEVAASIAAAAVSLSEVINKAVMSLASVTEDIKKVSSNVTAQTTLSDASVNDARDFLTAYTPGHVEAYRTALATTTAHLGNSAAEDARRSRTWFDKQVADVLAHDNDVRAIITQGLRNSAETDNMVGKQAVRHADTAMFQTAYSEGETNAMGAGAISADLGQATEAINTVAANLAAQVAALSASIAKMNAPKAA